MFVAVDGEEPEDADLLVLMVKTASIEKEVRALEQLLQGAIKPAKCQPHQCLLLKRNMHRTWAAGGR